MRDKLALIVVGLVLLAGLAGMFLLGREAADRRLDHSVIGTALLAPWLQSQGQEVQVANSRLSPYIEDLGLRILPLYDMDLREVAPPTTSRREAFYAKTQREIEDWIVTGKLQDLPSLLILPKWVSGVIGGKVGHSSALIPQADFKPLLRQLSIGKLELIRPSSGFMTADLPEGRIALFAPQLFTPESMPDICKAEVTLPQGVLVARCRYALIAHSFYILSDPDLINNHGLGLADNARVAAAWVARWNDGARPVYLDTSVEDYTRSRAQESDEAVHYERDRAAFARFFEPPFTILWAMLAVVFAVFFWRGAVRFGPMAVETDNLPEQTKAAAIATRARLLRLGGHDGRMVADFIRADLADLTQRTFGKGAAQAGLPRLFAHLARRNPAAAAAFQASAETLMTQGPNLPPEGLTRLLDQYRSQLETLTHADHDPVRLSRPRRGAAR